MFFQLRNLQMEQKKKDIAILRNFLLKLFLYGII